MADYTHTHLSPITGKDEPCHARVRPCKYKGHKPVQNAAESQFITEISQQLELAALEPTTPFKIELTPATERVLDALENAGLAPYVVGGSVRDAVMGGGITPKDIDIEVYGGEASVVAAALRKLGHVDEVGKSFGVLKIAINGEDFDVSLPRRDSKTGEGHRDFTVEVDPELSIEEASARRDYTINALMYSHRLGVIIDKHGGLADLKAGYLRHVSDAFDEDPLRVLRGVQMASRFGMRLHPDTIAKAATLREKYNTLAIERVQIEFQKLYEKGKQPGLALQTLRETGWNRLFPGLAEADQQLLDERVQGAQALIDTGEVGKDKRAVIMSAAIASALEPKDRLTFLKYTTVGDDTKHAAHQLTQLPAPEATPQQLRAWAHELPRQVSVRDWTLYQHAIGQQELASRVHAVAAKTGVLDKAEPDMVDGNSLLALFPERKPGPWVRVALDRVRAAQYAETFRTRETGLAWLQAHRGELTA
jgi:tRNA nucleotidyltransferase/poly(A) polymerase